MFQTQDRGFLESYYREKPLKKFIDYDIVVRALRDKYRAV
jgi:hypothetical protein